MGGINGIQTARQIRSLKHLDEQIMFLTSYPEYMVESFDVMTFQYLIKPITPYKVGGENDQAMPVLPSP